MRALDKLDFPGNRLRTDRGSSRPIGTSRSMFTPGPTACSAWTTHLVSHTTSISTSMDPTGGSPCPSSTTKCSSTKPTAPELFWSAWIIPTWLSTRLGRITSSVLTFRIASLISIGRRMTSVEGSRTPATLTSSWRRCRTSPKWVSDIYWFSAIKITCSIRRESFAVFRLRFCSQMPRTVWKKSWILECQIRAFDLLFRPWNSFLSQCESLRLMKVNGWSSRTIVKSNFTFIHSISLENISIALKAFKSSLTKIVCAACIGQQHFRLMYNDWLSGSYHKAIQLNKSLNTCFARATASTAILGWKIIFVWNTAVR